MGILSPALKAYLKRGLKQIETGTYQVIAML